MTEGDGAERTGREAPPSRNRVADLLATHSDKVKAVLAAHTKEQEELARVEGVVEVLAHEVVGNAPGLADLATAYERVTGEPGEIVLARAPAPNTTRTDEPMLKVGPGGKLLVNLNLPDSGEYRRGEGWQEVRLVDVHEDRSGGLAYSDEHNPLVAIDESTHASGQTFTIDGKALILNNPRHPERAVPFTNFLGWREGGLADLTPESLTANLEAGIERLGTALPSPEMPPAPPAPVVPPPGA